MLLISKIRKEPFFIILRFYENYVVMELVKNHAYAKSKANITYYRDSNAKEIDAFVEDSEQSDLIYNGFRSFSYAENLPLVQIW